MQKLLSIKNIKASKADNKTLSIQKDTEKVQNYLNKNAKKYEKVMLLSIHGNNKTSEEWARELPLGQKVCFVIGGAHGLDEELLCSNFSIHKISLGKQTMVHGLAKLVLIEQLYRVSMIHAGRNYHY